MTSSTATFQTGSQNRVMWDYDCDFYGSDIYAVEAIPDACGDLCANDASCTHWTWNNYNGGTCWLKNGASASYVTYYGAGCGYVTSRFSLPSDSASQSTTQTTTTTTTSYDDGLSDSDTQLMLDTINSYRNQNGLSSLTIDTRLVAAALAHSQDMANTCTMTHDGSDGSQPWERMAAQGYDWQEAAENVAAGQTSVSSVMTSWWNSAGHRANILNANVKNVGFALATNSGCSNYKTYWTQDFGLEA